MKRFDRTRFSQEDKRVSRTRGLTVFYCGDGKGKTTAAIGLAVRALGAGMRVCVCQFIKSEQWQSYERETLARLRIPVHVLGLGFVKILGNTRSIAQHKRQAKKALQFVHRLMRSGRYDLLIADELVSAIDERLLTERDVCALIRAKPSPVHLVLTGHSRYASIIRACDLVTEMHNIKHPYYSEGLLAQRGIDY
jgi:cob(I)alamin adenosyltransferase